MAKGARTFAFAATLTTLALAAPARRRSHQLSADRDPQLNAETVASRSNQPTPASLELDARGQYIHRLANQSEVNLFYTKVTKTASSTLNGVARRIAAHNGINHAHARHDPICSEQYECGTRVWIDWFEGEPGLWSDEGDVSTLEKWASHAIFARPPQAGWRGYDSQAPNCTKAMALGNRPKMMEGCDMLPKGDAGLKALRLPTFKFSVLRDPVERTMSMYYYSQRWKPPEPPPNTTADTAGKLAALARPENEQLRQMQPFVDAGAQETYDWYHVVGVNERIDESLVLLAYTLRIPLSDVLYTSAKVCSAHIDTASAADTCERREMPTGFNNPPSPYQPCTGKLTSEHTPLADEPPVVQQAAASAAFKQKNAEEYALYKLADAELTRKIELYGLADAVAQFKALLDEAHDVTCPIHDDSDCYLGELKDYECYGRDSGCNYKCYDKEYDGKVPCTWC